MGAFQPYGNCRQPATSRNSVSQVLYVPLILPLLPFERHTRILHLLRSTRKSGLGITEQRLRLIQHIATLHTKAIISHKITLFIVSVTPLTNGLFLTLHLIHVSVTLPVLQRRWEERNTLKIMTVSVTTVMTC